MSGRSAQPVAIIADDESIGRLLLVESAAAAGLKPLSFDNGNDALQAALSLDVAMVLLDVEMPGLNGFEVCRELRAMKRASLPIVMVTGLDDRDAVNRAFEAGATDFVTKPVNWPLLPHRLAYILRNADREAKIVTLVDAMPDTLWVVSPTGEVRWTHGQESLEAVIPTQHFANVLKAIYQTAQDGRAQKTDLRDLDCSMGGVRSCELRFTRVEGGDVLVVRQDTSERTRAAHHIEKLAFYDPLTGLPNRQHCLDHVTRALTRAEEGDEGLALLYVDLNNFKRINDTFGHSIGDAVLQRVAAMLQSLLASRAASAPPAFLARLGGDEFVVALRCLHPRSIATELAAAICAELAKPVAYETLEFLATPSIGIAVYPEDGKNVETLLKHADTAMYQAKINGGPKVVAYLPAMSARLRDSIDLETRLRRALRADALQICYQPKFRLRDGALVGSEALLRWFDEELGDISPNRFIPVAEESGLIVDIGAWIMRAVCDQLRVWHAKGIAVPVAVNVSGKELLFADPSRTIKAETDRAGVPTSLIEAEITESVFVTDLTTARSSVNRIRQLGCRIALDDFGTGYSSLSYLTRFPPDRVKIDRSFIANVDRSENDGAIVKAIISLAKTLNLLVTAEGVERPGQLEWLKTFGCDEVQGYLLAKPLSARDLECLFLRPDPIAADAESAVRIA